jgi:4-hydroxybenzoate polyprenyltransferase
MATNPPRSAVPPLLRAMRPPQWIKNLACVLPVVFSGHLRDLPLVLRALAAGAVFCLAASAVYLINDLKDAARDRLHPVKKDRPIAAGELSPAAAASAAAVLAAAAVALSLRISPDFWEPVAFYLAMNAAYSLLLREQPLIDVFWIAIGFCVRVIAGILAIESKMSPWIVLATFFLMLMIGFGKRRAELARAGSGRRASLSAYTPALIDRWLTASGGLAVATYSLFAILSSPNPDLILTVPFVVYGIFRYLLLAETGADTEFPETLVLRDRASLVNGLLWLACYVLLASRPASFFTR